MKNSFKKFSFWFLPILMLSALDAQDSAKERWLQKTGFRLKFHYEAFKNHTSEPYNKKAATVDSAMLRLPMTANPPNIYLCG